MALGSRTPNSEHSLTGLSTSAAYKWGTGWYPAIALDKIKGVIRTKNATGNYQARLALQTAAVRTDNPDSPVQLESSFMAGSNERCTGILDITANTASAFWVRFGICYNLSSGTTPGTGDTDIELSYDAAGRILGAQTLRLSTSDTGNYYDPLTPFIPAIHADKVKATLVVSGAMGNFEVRLAYRTATTSIHGPNVWSSTFDSWHVGAGEYNTGELTPSTSSDRWVQFGLQHSLTSGTNGGAFITAHVAIRKT